MRCRWRSGSFSATASARRSGCLSGPGASDALDGYIAKRFDRTRTRLGALLDPVADKALLASVYVALGLAGLLPNWLVILVVFRDVMIIGGFLLIQVDRRAAQFRSAL